MDSPEFQRQLLEEYERQVFNLYSLLRLMRVYFPKEELKEKEEEFKAFLQVWTGFHQPHQKVLRKESINLNRFKREMIEFIEGLTE